MFILQHKKQYVLIIYVTPTSYISQEFSEPYRLVSSGNYQNKTITTYLFNSSIYHTVRVEHIVFHRERESVANELANELPVNVYYIIKTNKEQLIALLVLVALLVI